MGNIKTTTKGALAANTSTTRFYNYMAGTNRLLDIRIGSTTGTVESSVTHDFEGRLKAQPVLCSFRHLLGGGQQAVSRFAENKDMPPTTSALPLPCPSIAESMAANARECLNLAVVGCHAREARKAEGFTQRQLAKEACISPATLRRVEQGDPGVPQEARHRVLTLLPALAHGASGSLAHGHHIQDIQSLLLHRAAVRLILAHPPLVHKALQTIHNWLSNNPDSRTAPLWRQWQTFLEARASESGGRGVSRAWDQVSAVKWQQMRQASPLPTVLPPEVRAAVLEVVRDWKHKLEH